MFDFKQGQVVLAIKLHGTLQRRLQVRNEVGPSNSDCLCPEVDRI